MIGRCVVTTCLVATAALAACTGGSSEPTPIGNTSSSSSSGATSSASSSGSPLAIAQTIVSATLSGAQCPSAGATVKVGDFGDPYAKPPVASQPARGSWQGRSLAFDCSVKASGDGFAVLSTMDFDDDRVGQNGLTSAGGGNFTVDVKIGAAEHEHENCALEYPTGGGVATGRFWAKLTCPAEAGGDPCAIEAEVRLENCAQK
jgi:hypothetical protein